MGYVGVPGNYLVSSSHPIYVIFGDHTRCFNFAKEDFCVADNVKVLLPKTLLSLRSLMFITSAWKRAIPEKGYARHWSVAQKAEILLPTKDECIDYAFMESFIAEIEALRLAELEAQHLAELNAYLTAAGLKDSELTAEEQTALQQLEAGQIPFSAFTYDTVFNHIEQGRRLKKSDQLPGDIPFVMAGVTNSGVSNHISNPVALFPANSITLDIFGNAFYRPYIYGAGDDTGAYWNTKRNYTKEEMLFLTSAMTCSVRGVFSFGHKLRSSKSKKLRIYLPTNNNQLDTHTMRQLISAVQKLVIRDVVAHADAQIAATRTAISNNASHS